MGNPYDGACPGTWKTDPRYAHGRCQACQIRWNQWRSERRAQRVADGQCGQCGTPNSNGTHTCDGCTAERRAAAKRRHTAARHERLWALVHGLRGRRLRLALWVLRQAGYELALDHFHRAEAAE